ncbi:MAG: hypothetical protein MUF43_05070 [Flavobacterium sp.]|jgi:hypothetical protein|nr:hypothetical protein [Flavobacterium sp.]
MQKLLALLFICCFQLAVAQKFSLSIEGNSIAETQIIDSLGYTKKHETVASILETQKEFEKKLAYSGFVSYELLSQKKVNDSSFVFTYQLGYALKKINIYIGKLSPDEKLLLEETKDSIVIATNQTENWMQLKLKLLEIKGFSLAKLQLTNVTQKENELFAELSLITNKKRIADDLVILGYDKFPKNIKHQLKQNLKNRTFNQDLVTEVYSTLTDFPFVNQTKYPEILFTNDETKIYTYLEKAKPNRFDGFIGFANDENSKLTFNGYLDLALQNVFNSGEKLALYWKNDGNQQSTFNLGGEVPYLFKSPIGIQANLRIFRQDSTFQNTQSELNLGYYFSYNKKLFIGTKSITSADIQNINNSNLNDFKSRFYTIGFDYLKRNLTDFFFPEKTNLRVKLGYGNRTVASDKNPQLFGQLEVSHNLYLNSKNSINLKSQSFYLQSDSYLVNELHRFGGINSIRGFRENSLQANLYSGILLEYRYLLAPTIYIHSITDYGFFQDKTSNLTENLLGLGFGFGLFTNNGIFNLVYANGSTSEQGIKLSNSIVQISFKTNF